MINEGIDSISGFFQKLLNIKSGNATAVNSNKSNTIGSSNSLSQNRSNHSESSEFKIKLSRPNLFQSSSSKVKQNSELVGNSVDENEMNPSATNLKNIEAINDRQTLNEFQQCYPIDCSIGQTTSLVHSELVPVKRKLMQTDNELFRSSNKPRDAKLIENVSTESFYLDQTGLISEPDLEPVATESSIAGSSDPKAQLYPKSAKLFFKPSKDNKEKKNKNESKKTGKTKESFDKNEKKFNYDLNSHGLTYEHSTVKKSSSFSSSTSIGTSSSSDNLNNINSGKENVNCDLTNLINELSNQIDENSLSKIKVIVKPEPNNITTKIVTNFEKDTCEPRPVPPPRVLSTARLNKIKGSLNNLCYNKSKLSNSIDLDQIDIDNEQKKLISLIQVYHQNSFPNYTDNQENQGLWPKQDSFRRKCNTLNFSNNHSTENKNPLTKSNTETMLNRIKSGNHYFGFAFNQPAHSLVNFKKNLNLYYDNDDNFLAGSSSSSSKDSLENFEEKINKNSESISNSLTNISNSFDSVSCSAINLIHSYNSVSNLSKPLAKSTNLFNSKKCITNTRSLTNLTPQSLMNKPVLSNKPVTNFLKRERSSIMFDVNNNELEKIDEVIDENIFDVNNLNQFTNKLISENLQPNLTNTYSICIPLDLHGSNETNSFSNVESLTDSLDKKETEKEDFKKSIIDLKDFNLNDDNLLLSDNINKKKEFKDEINSMIEFKNIETKINDETLSKMPQVDYKKIRPDFIENEQIISKTLDTNFEKDYENLSKINGHLIKNDDYFTKNFALTEGIGKSLSEIESNILGNRTINRKKFSKNDSCKSFEYNEKLIDMEMQISNYKNKYNESIQMISILVQKCNEITDAFDESFEKKNKEIVNLKRTNKILENQNKELLFQNQKISNNNIDLECLTNKENKEELEIIQQKYKNLKKELDCSRDNEQQLIQELESLKIKFQQNYKLYETVKERALETVKNANEMIEDANKNSERELSLAKMHVKKSELKIKKLEKELDLKIKENQELNQLLDEMQ